jgi:hypothetical protein
MHIMTPNEAKAIAEAIALRNSGGGYRHLAGDIAAALLGAAGQWHEIDGENPAPKDGTRIMVYSPDRCGNCPEGTPGMAIVNWSGGGWSSGRLLNGQDLRLTHQPTHWRPLCAPPEAALKERDA